MTDSEKLARWQGKCYHVSDWGQTICKYCGRTNDPRYFDFDSINSDYLNDDTAAMSLLDTLVEKGFDVSLEHDNDGWICCYIRDIDKCYIWEDGGYHTTRREAVVAACLELIEKEDL